ncbi:uncharacterized protein L3040_007215 [Drepanopeziza brunnea f. sp. 'multigermtubi']|uniref:uncharacterized protein n=1 Tax=Drepanopeziza brunnea f. sp. 'multigermtubi' TaxID=698441 RepID=UPI0023A10B21|nr:hypothetical protein L3040_007215 [Drepanopeziza brunnea f. sp. 'multigermtubi']
MYPVPPAQNLSSSCERDLAITSSPSDRPCQTGQTSSTTSQHCDSFLSSHASSPPKKCSTFAIAQIVSHRTLPTPIGFHAAKNDRRSHTRNRGTEFAEAGFSALVPDSQKAHYRRVRFDSRHLGWPRTAGTSACRRICFVTMLPFSNRALNGGFEEGETQPLDWNFREVDVGKHETRDLEMILANTAKGNPLRTLIAEAALSMGGAHAR